MNVFKAQIVDWANVNKGFNFKSLTFDFNKIFEDTVTDQIEFEERLKTFISNLRKELESAEGNNLISLFSESTLHNILYAICLKSDLSKNLIDQKGSVDIALKVKNLGIIFELKHNKNTKEVLDQIDKQEYFKGFNDENDLKKVVAIAISFRCNKDNPIVSDISISIDWGCYMRNNIDEEFVKFEKTDFFDQITSYSINKNNNIDNVIEKDKSHLSTIVKNLNKIQNNSEKNSGVSYDLKQLESVLIQRLGNLGFEKVKVLNAYKFNQIKNEYTSEVDHKQLFQEINKIFNDPDIDIILLPFPEESHFIGVVFEKTTNSFSMQYMNSDERNEEKYLQFLAFKKYLLDQGIEECKRIEVSQQEYSDNSSIETIENFIAYLEGENLKNRSISQEKAIHLHKDYQDFFSSIKSISISNLQFDYTAFNEKSEQNSFGKRSFSTKKTIYNIKDDVASDNRRGKMN